MFLLVVVAIILLSLLHSVIASTILVIIIVTILGHGTVSIHGATTRLRWLSVSDCSMMRTSDLTRLRGPSGNGTEGYTKAL